MTSIVKLLPGGGPLTSLKLSELVAATVTKHYKVTVSAHYIFTNILPKEIKNPSTPGTRNE